MAVFPIQVSFARGELTPKLHGRVDVEHYALGLATATNWIVIRQGGIRRRPGFRYIHPVRDSSVKARLAKFEFNAEQAYALCFNGGYIRFFTLGGIVTQASQAISGITKANPAVVTYAGADTYANGDRVLLSGIVGMTELNNREATVANVNAGANTFELSGINSTGYTTYVSGGTVKEIYEVAHTYSESELFDLQFAQSADTIYIAHKSHAPAKLVRSSELSWTLSDVAFEDGPYLDEATQGTVLTPASRGAAVPTMSDNTTPSGTASDSGASVNAWRVFDASEATGLGLATSSQGSVTYDLAGAATVVADAYWLASNDTTAMVTSWVFEGFDGTNWVALDTRDDETGWSAGERRYFEFLNTQAFQSYRLRWVGLDAAATTVGINMLAIHEAGDSQTAFNLTASAVTGINAGAGFVAGDVGRSIRLQGSDGHWRWAKIVARTSSTVVTIRLYNHALLDLTAISHWQLGKWNSTDGYPATVGFDANDRLAWGGSDGSPRAVALSVTSDYANHETHDPLIDSDGIDVTMTGGSLNRITFLEELADGIAIGTAGGMRILGPNDAGQAFANDNLKQTGGGRVGAAGIQPITIGQALLFADRYKKRLYEFAYDWRRGGYWPRELSILSDHLLIAGLTQLAYLQDPDNLVLNVMADGTLTCLTYEQEQQIAGFTPLQVAGGGTANAVVESAAAIPSSGGDVLYAVNKRTINGATVRYVEYMAPTYETGNDITDAVYLDSAGVYDSTPTGTVSGLNWLIGESLGILADGLDIGDATVSAAGNLTLPSSLTASTITVGKRYTSTAKTLRPPTAGNQDGSALGRRKIVGGVFIDMLNAAGIYVKTDENVAEPIAPRDFDTALTAPAVLITGIKKVPGLTDSRANGGQLTFYSDRAYPATVRALVLQLDGEP